MATERGSMAADLDMHAMAIDAAARSRDESGLESYLAIAEESAARARHNLYIAVARRARGVSYSLAGEFDDAAEQLAVAADEFRALDTQWQIGRTLLELGEVEQTRGNAELAKEHFSAALSALESLNAEPDAVRARSALEALN